MKEIRIKLNFLPFTNQDFDFLVYRQDYVGQPKAEGFFRKQLPVTPNSEEYQQYFVTFKKTESFTEFRCKCSFNPYLTVSYLWDAFLSQVSGNLKSHEYILSDRTVIKKYLSIIIAEDNVGKEVINIEPYHLKCQNKFGVLIDFKFKKNFDVPFSKAVQQLSLSLDKNFKSNANFYSDKYDKILTFMKMYGKRLFPISYNGSNYDIHHYLYPLTPQYLKSKTYLFAGSKHNNSQFNGVKDIGPLQGLEKEVIFIYLFQDNQRDLANDVYKTLTGAMFPSVFSGMKTMFGVDMHKDNVKRLNFKSYDKPDLEQIEPLLLQIRQENQDKLIIGLFIEHAKEFTTGAAVSPYYFLKYVFTKNHTPLQAITIEGIRGRNGLKWSASGLGLQIFAKMGGIPWKVKPSNDNCLIFGIGSAHKTDDKGEIQKYFAYSVCMDSSGIYKKLDVLSEGDTEESYIAKFKLNIKNIFSSSLGSGITKCAIHLPFKIKLIEIRSIKEVINDLRTEDNQVEFVFVKINTDNKYFGYADNNSKVPYEGSCLKLSWTEYLVWFEGLQWGKEIVSRRISSPVHIEFIDDTLEDEEKRQRYLQDVINLSGANWRGFNAKMAPISIFYPEIIARYLSEFRAFNGDKDLDISQIPTPWFL